jgi:hypothetical protein
VRRKQISLKQENDMPAKSSTHKTLVRHVAPLAPLALSLLVGTAVLPSAKSNLTPTEVQNVLTPVACDEVTDFEDCHSRYPAGCGNNRYDAYLNILKNQVPSPPSASQQVPFFTSLSDYDQLNREIPSTLKKGNHINVKDDLDKAGEGQERGILGYLYYVKKEGAESSNCGLEGKDTEGTDVDYHIGIGFDADLAAKMASLKSLSPEERKNVQHDAKSHSVVVEMTPHYRALFEPEVWTLDNVSKVVGREVKVVGQLMADNEHNIGSQNCAVASKPSELATCWRYSIWELHPVTKFQVCADDSCPMDSAKWLELDQVGTAVAASRSSAGGGSTSNSRRNRHTTTPETQ